jgi:hypothetical protein
MCNLYSITRSQDAMRRLFRIKRDVASYDEFIARLWRSVDAQYFATTGGGGAMSNL